MPQDKAARRGHGRLPCHSPPTDWLPKTECITPRLLSAYACLNLLTLTNCVTPDIMLSHRFFIQIGLLQLTICAGYSALVLGAATWPKVQLYHQLVQTNSDGIFHYHLSSIMFEGTRAGIVLVTLLTICGLIGLAASPLYRMEWYVTGNSMYRTGRGLLVSWKKLSSRERNTIILGMLILTALRCYFSFLSTPHDDAASYLFFVRPGWLAVSAYYPVPNNHILSNAISLLFYQLNTGFWWSMRLPVLITSTIATIVLLLALVRNAGTTAALVALALFSLLQGSLYQAGAGRGYWLVIFLAGIIFFSSVTQKANWGRHRTAWLAVLAAGTLGCYTVPTFAYVLVSAFLWLGWVFLRQRGWAQLVRLGVVGGLIVLSVGLLYTPLFLVSGLNSLINNQYVVAHDANFFANLPAYIWHNEGILAGNRTWGGLLTVAVLGLTGYLFYQIRAGQMPLIQVARWHRLVPPAFCFIVLPYVMMLVQRVLTPDRVLLYKAFPFCILAGLVVDWVLWRWPAPRYRWPRFTLAMGFVFYASYQIFTVARGNPTVRGLDASYRAGLRWLATQPVGPVLIPEPMQCLYFRFYATTEAPLRQWQLDSIQQHTVKYRYVVAFPNDRGFFQPRFPFQPVYQNKDVTIYAPSQQYWFDVKPWLKH